MPPGKYHIISTKELEPELIRQAQEQGITLTVQPFIETFPLRSQQLTAIIHQLAGNPLKILFTSSYAITAIAEILQELIPESWKIYCLEGHTLDTVRLLFPRIPVLGSARDSRKLGKLIVESGDQGPFVFFCGNRRRPDLPETLNKASLPLEEIIVYKTINLSVAMDIPYDGVLFFSPSGAESFFSANVVPEGKICFAIGDTTAKMISSHTNNRVITCENPGREAMIGELIRHFGLNSQVL